MSNSTGIFTIERKNASLRSYVKQSTTRKLLNRKTSLYSSGSPTEVTLHQECSEGPVMLNHGSDVNIRIYFFLETFTSRWCGCVGIQEALSIYTSIKLASMGRFKYQCSIV